MEDDQTRMTFTLLHIYTWLSMVNPSHIYNHNMDDLTLVPTYRKDDLSPTRSSKIDGNAFIMEDYSPAITGQNPSLSPTHLQMIG
jgi:hypothetical protein